MSGKSTRHARDRLLDKIVVADGGCHVFTGSRNDRGYGQIWHEGRLWYTHRFVWTQANGEIEPGLQVMHSCDNPPCCNLEHLSLGDHRDNALDMMMKGRGRGQLKPGQTLPSPKNGLLR